MFSELPEYLRRGDVLVLNETRVIPARIMARRASGARVELLLLHPASSLRYDPLATHWVALVKPGRRVRDGERLTLGDFGFATVGPPNPGGARDVTFSLGIPFEQFLAAAGTLPLPPYIHNDSDDAQSRYQTVFARNPGSVAAPTASLHFTQDVLDRCVERGVEIVKLTLDVGLGTFRPIANATLEGHRMHSEAYEIPEQTAHAVTRAKSQGRRVVAAGTTVVRALEGNALAHGAVRPGLDTTDLFIAPEFSFSVVDALVTNFHLPRSTLLVLVCAFAGRDAILTAYREAIARKYRFFSFGDAMLLEREGA